MALARQPQPFSVGFGLVGPSLCLWLWPMVALAFVLAHDGLDLLPWANGALGLINLAHGHVSPATFAAWGLECLSRCRSVFVRTSTLPVQAKRQLHLA